MTYDCFSFPVSGHRLELLYTRVSIPICSEQTGNELKLQPLSSTQHWSRWRPWGCQTLVRGSQEVITPQAAQGPNSWEPDLPQPAQGFNPGGYHISACLGICTLIRGCLALRLHPY